MIQEMQFLVDPYGVLYHLEVKNGKFIHSWDEVGVMLNSFGEKQDLGGRNWTPEICLERPLRNKSNGAC